MLRISKRWKPTKDSPLDWMLSAGYRLLKQHTIIIIIFKLRTAAFKAYCANWVRRSNFRHQASPRVSPRESTQRRKVELWARNAREFCLNADFYVTFRDLLHAVKLRHGADGFTSPPKVGVLRIFFAPANLGTKGQHATSRPPKPLTTHNTLQSNAQVEQLILVTTAIDVRFL